MYYIYLTVTVTTYYYCSSRVQWERFIAQLAIALKAAFSCKVKKLGGI